jgi:hypothetical protein
MLKRISSCDDLSDGFINNNAHDDNNQYSNYYLDDNNQHSNYYVDYHDQYSYDHNYDEHAYHYLDHHYEHYHDDTGSNAYANYARRNKYTAHTTKHSSGLCKLGTEHGMAIMQFGQLCRRQWNRGVLDGSEPDDSLTKW